MSNRPTPKTDNLRRLREKAYAESHQRKPARKSMVAAVADSVMALMGSVADATARSEATAAKKRARKAAKRSKGKSGAMPPPTDASE